MLAAAVAGVDDGTAHDLGDFGRRSICLVADDQHVWLHRVQGKCRIRKAPALLPARRVDVEVGDLRAQPLARDLEREKSSRAALRKLRRATWRERRGMNV